MLTIGRFSLPDVIIFGNISPLNATKSLIGRPRITSICVFNYKHTKVETFFDRISYSNMNHVKGRLLTHKTPDKTRH